MKGMRSGDMRSLILPRTGTTDCGCYQKAVWDSEKVNGADDVTGLVGNVRP